VDRASGRVVRLKLEGSRPRYLPSGHLVYASSDGSLHAVGFDTRQMAIIGTPVPVLEGVGVKVSGAANFDVSADGHLVYVGGGVMGGLRTLVWVDRRGAETPIAAPPRNYFYARVSPDASRVALDVRDQEQDIWVWDIKREELSRLTDSAGRDEYALWTPDQHLVSSSVRGESTELVRHRPDGVGQPVQITDNAAAKLVAFPNAITPDGRQLIFRAVVGAKNDLFVVDMGGDRKARPLLSSPHDERNAALSPDGAFMAFESDMTGGQMDVFVRPFPNVDSGQYKVSIDGGTKPLWSPDGREIFYLGSPGSRTLMAVSVTRSAGRLQLGKPEALFDVGSYFFGGIGRNYDITPDGRRFVMVKSLDSRQNDAAPITLVLNWGEELRERVK
jgi:serine/threonine-protein kinase